MGPEAAVNAVHANRIAAHPEADRPALVQALRDEYERDIDLGKLASDLVVDDVVPAADLRDQLAARLALAARPVVPGTPKKHGVHPV
jgi:acetyl-CoA carboxylase carboxyltransferase component